MKKQLLALLAFGATMSVSAQDVSIQHSTHGVQPGMTQYVGYDTLFVYSDQGTGTDIVWDFRGLIPNLQDTTDITAPDPEYADEFPEANVSFDSGNGPIYAKDSDSELVLLGTVFPNMFNPEAEPGIIHFDPAVIINKFPSVYDDSYLTQNNFEFEMVLDDSTKADFQQQFGVEIESIRITHEEDINVVFDGSGYVIMDNGWFPVLKNTRTSTGMETVEACIVAIPGLPCTYQTVQEQEINAVQYIWDFEQDAFPLVGHAIDNNTGQFSTEFNMKPGFTGLKEAPGLAEFTVFPNPVVNELHFVENATEVKIIDVTGKTVLVANNATKVDTRALSSGVYSIQHTNVQGITKVGKFVVNK